MEKEERAGNGPGLQGLFRAPTVSDLDMRRKAQHLLESSLILRWQKGNPSTVQRALLDAPSPPRGLGLFCSSPSVFLSAMSPKPLSLGLKRLLKSWFGFILEEQDCESPG